MKFNRVNLIERVERRIADATEYVVAERAMVHDEYVEAVEAWWSDDAVKLRVVLVELLARCDRGDEPVVRGDVSNLSRYAFRGGSAPTLVTAADVAVSRSLTALLDFLRNRDDAVVSSYALNECGFASALRDLHDAHARVAWLDHGGRRATADR